MHDKTKFEVHNSYLKWFLTYHEAKTCNLKIYLYDPLTPKANQNYLPMVKHTINKFEVHTSSGSWDITRAEKQNGWKDRQPKNILQLS